MRFSVREKSWLLPSGRLPRRIRFGLLGGLSMRLDLAHDSQRWLGLQERELFPWLRRLGRDINTAFDVGANDGVYTLYFLARTRAHKIYSFEPSPECVRELKNNLALNNLGANERLEVATQKVGDSTAEEWTTLDSFASSIVPPCLIKVDIDGGERDLLKGAPRFLLLPGIRWIIEVHSKALEQYCLQALKDAGYHVVIVPNAWWRNIIPELRPGELNHWLVAYRDEENEKCSA
jgi:hypothetical protein